MSINLVQVVAPNTAGSDDEIVSMEELRSFLEKWLDSVDLDKTSLNHGVKAVQGHFVSNSHNAEAVSDLLKVGLGPSMCGDDRNHLLSLLLRWSSSW